MRTTEGLQRVDVIYRRLDDDFMDPVHFRSDSMLGVPGIVNAVRTGGVALANAIGNGVADDKLIYTYVPDLIRYYLHEEPIIRNIDTWRLEEDEARAEVLDRLDELVVKPVDGSGGKGIVIGPRASRRGARRPAAPGDRRSPRLDRPAAGPALHRADPDRRHARPAARRPAAVRGEHRRRRVRPARRTDPGRAARGRAGGEQQPGRRQQGHLGAQRAAAPSAARRADEAEAEVGEEVEVDEVADAAPEAKPAAAAAARRADGDRPPARLAPDLVRRSEPQQEQQQQGVAEAVRPAQGTSVRRRRRTDGRAEPDRGVDVLDRALRRAGRRHRPAAADPPPGDDREHIRPRRATRARTCWR